MEVFKWALLSDAKQRLGGKFWVLLKEVENQLTMICGNWQGVLLECAYTAHSVTLCGFDSKSSKKHNYVYYFSPTQSECNRSQLDGFSLSLDMTLGNITPNYFCWLIRSLATFPQWAAPLPFPVELVGFSAKNSGNSIHWQMLQTVNNITKSYSITSKTWLLSCVAIATYGRWKRKVGGHAVTWGQ